MVVICMDWDGVVADSCSFWMHRYRELMKRYPLPAIKNREDFVALYQHNLYQSIVDGGFPAARLGELMIAFRRISDGIYPPLFEGMKKLMNVLGDQYTVYIVTSNDSKVVESMLVRAEIKGVTEVLGADKEKSKVIKLKRVMKKHEHEEIFFVTDTTGDLEEGKRAGVKTVAVTWGYHSKKMLEEAEPDFLVKTPKKLLEVIG